MRLVSVPDVTAPADARPDLELIRACATDRAACATLFERHVDAVHRFIARMAAADASSVDDLVQATFVAAFRAAATFRGDAEVRSWLLGIATNMVRGHARSEIRRKAALALVDTTGVVEAASAQAERAQLIARLEAALPALPHDLRVAFVLIDLEGMRGVDAAAIVGVPAGTMWRRLHEARLALRAALEDTP